MDLQGKTAFITGGGGGIGGGIAEALVEKGANVILADIDVASAEAKTAALGPCALAVAIDVASRESWAQARAIALDRFGQVDILCNNAGISIRWSALHDVPIDAFEHIMRINAFSVFYGIKTFVPDMVSRQDGHVVNTGSFNGLVPYGTAGPYSATKFAVAALSGSLRDELAPHGIGVSTLYPGYTRSKMSEAVDRAERSGDAEARRHSLVMMEPIWSGRAVARAIEQNAPHIVTHPEHKDRLEAWFGEILGAFGEPAQPGHRSRPAG